MPLKFDPEWEYWCPDPEIAEILTESSRCNPFDTIKDWRSWDRDYRGFAGIRFGRGNPNFCRFRLGREKVRQRELLEDRPCKTCGWVFTPARRSQLHCSWKCGNKLKGAPRVLADRECRCCGVLFRPRDDTRVFCGRDCANAAQTGCSPHLSAFRGGRPSRLPTVEDRFASLFQGGAPLAAIMTECQITKATVKRWRRKLGLPARPSGNHSRVAGSRRDCQ